MAKDFKWFGKEVGKKVTLKADQALLRAAIMVENRAKTSMREPKSGSHHAGQPRQSSAANQAPAVQTGRLRASITHERVGPLTVRVGTNVKYGKYLEHGTAPYTIRAKIASVLSDGTNFFGTKVDHPGVRARPWLRPAFETVKRQIEKLFKGIV